MAGDDFEETLSGFRDWAGATGRKLSGGRDTDAAELGILFGLMPSHLGIEEPSRLVPGSLTELLLDVYPRKVTVLDREDTADTIPAVRDLIAYLADTHAITQATAQNLALELDGIEPGFADMVMDPANWGPARATMHAMHADGVNIDDSAAVRLWIARQREIPFPDEADDPLWNTIDLKESFGVRNMAAPVRLPDEKTLAELARTAPLLTDLRELLRQVRTTPVRTQEVDPLLLRLAVEARFVKTDGDTLGAGDDADRIDDLSSSVTALAVWDYVFAQVLETTLEEATRIEPNVLDGCDLALQAISTVMGLYLHGHAGIPVADLDLLNGAAFGDLPQDAAMHQWDEWVRAHGDPTRVLFGQLEKLSAVTVTDDVVHLEPLGTFAITAKLEACRVRVPKLPPSDKMTVHDLMLIRRLGTEDDFESEFSSWLAQRTGEDAGRALLGFAADETAAIRTLVIPMVSQLGAAAEPVWRVALDRPELRCYAKRALLGILAERDPDAKVPIELDLGIEDVAWAVLDDFGPLTGFDHDDYAMPFDITTLSDTGLTVTNEALFETMARLDHPDAVAVLTMVGKHADNKKTAKAARRAAFKATTRRAART